MNSIKRLAIRNLFLFEIVRRIKIKCAIENLCGIIR